MSEAVQNDEEAQQICGGRDAVRRTCRFALLSVAAELGLNPSQSISPGDDGDRLSAATMQRIKCCLCGHGYATDSRYDDVRARMSAV